MYHRAQDIITSGNSQASLSNNVNILNKIKERSKTPNQQRQFSNTQLLSHGYSQSPQPKSPSQHQEIKTRIQNRNKNINQQIDSFGKNQYNNGLNFKQPIYEKSITSNHYQQELSLIHLNFKAAQPQTSSNVSNLSTSNNSNNNSLQLYAQMVTLSSQNQKLVDEQKQYLTIIESLQKNNFQLLQIIKSCSRCQMNHQDKIQQGLIESHVDQHTQEFLRKVDGLTFKDSQTQDNFYHDIINQFENISLHKQKLISELQGTIKNMNPSQTNEIAQKNIHELKSKTQDIFLYQSEMIKELIQFNELVMESYQKNHKENKHFKDLIQTLENSLKAGSKNKDIHHKSILLPSCLKALQMV